MNEDFVIPRRYNGDEAGAAHEEIQAPRLSMPHKYNADRRHRIPKARYTVMNWRDYEAGLRQRGSLTIWFTEEAIAAWRAAPRTAPGGQARYSDLAIETSLILRAVFHQPLRQTEGARCSG